MIQNIITLLKTYKTELRILCVLTAFGCTGLLLFKDLYFHTWEEKGETITYSIPLVFVFFIWIWSRLGDLKNYKPQLIGIDVLVVALSAIRILGLLFHSGHALFLTYIFLTNKNKTYRALCIPMIGITTYIKYSWGDWFTPLFGILIGLGFYYWRKKQK